MSGHQLKHVMMDSTAARRTEQEHDVNLDVDINESETPGTYAAQFTPSQAGEHRVMFHIRSVGDRKFEPEIVVEATRTVPKTASGHDSGMLGMGGGTQYVIIGAAVMGAMMIAIWAAGGRMF